MTPSPIVPSPIAMQARGSFNIPPRLIETDKKSWVVVTVNADVVNVASTSLGGQCPMMSQFHAADVVYVRDADARTTPISGLAEMMPDDLHIFLADTRSNCSVGVMPNIWGVYSEIFPTATLVEVSVPNFYDPPPVGTLPNYRFDQTAHYIGEQLASAFRPKRDVSEFAKPEDEMANMISGSQSMLTVASSVFNDMRPLTDKERLYLGKFYNRAFKTR